MMDRSALILGVAVLGLAGGCVTQSVIKVNDTPAIQAQEDIPEGMLLDVGIALLDPGVPEDFDVMVEENIVPDVREAEARYLPYTLRNTLQDTGNWGAVRVVPRDTSAVEILVTGTIVKSDGETLTVNVETRDATGRVWFDNEYTETASKYSYTEQGPGADLDPFQDMFNSIANDMLAARQKLSDDEVRNIRSVAELKFATDLSPYAFDEHLQVSEDGMYEVNRLPAKSDPMMVRMYSIREREYMFIDTLDQLYGDFYNKMDPAYEEWRKFSYEEAIALRELEEAAFRRKVLGTAAIIAGAAGAMSNQGYVTDIASNVIMYGGVSLFRAGMEAKNESRMHAEAMRELAESFSIEVQPLVVEVEGETITLNGSVEEQYEEWRGLLRQIYTAETGFAPEEETDNEAEANSDGSSEF